MVKVPKVSEAIGDQFTRLENSIQWIFSRHIPNPSWDQSWKGFFIFAIFVSNSKLFLYNLWDEMGMWKLMELAFLELWKLDSFSDFSSASTCCSGLEKIDLFRHFILWSFPSSTMIDDDFENGINFPCCASFHSMETHQINQQVGREWRLRDDVSESWCLNLIF